MIGRTNGRAVSITGLGVYVPERVLSNAELERLVDTPDEWTAARALVVGGDVLSKILDWDDRSTLVLFGDGAGAVVIERADEGGFLGFELGADGGGGENLWLPGSGSRVFEDPDRFVKMNGREV